MKIVVWILWSNFLTANLNSKSRYNPHSCIYRQAKSTIYVVDNYIGLRTLLECGFCGANLSRRRWHSSSKYTKTIWQCVESTKHGKRFCPDNKGIPEQVIED